MWCERMGSILSSRDNVCRRSQGHKLSCSVVRMTCSNGFFMDKGFHAEGYERMAVVVMMSVEMGMSGDPWVCVGLAQKSELMIHLWKELTPELEGELVICATDD